MSTKEELLYEVINELTIKNEQLEREIVDLKAKLKQVKASLMAYRARTEDQDLL